MTESHQAPPGICAVLSVGVTAALIPTFSRSLGCVSPNFRSRTLSHKRSKQDLAYQNPLASLLKNR